MGSSWRVLLLMVCTCCAYVALVGGSRRLQDNSWGKGNEPLPPPLPPVDIDKHVTHWHDLGIHDYTFVGTWGADNVTYQAAVWIRLIPANSRNERDARLVIRLNRAPAMFIEQQHFHAITPKEMLKDGKLPAIKFTAILAPGAHAEEVVVKQQYWEEYVTSEWLCSTINGRAVLKADTQYTLSMEGSEHLFQIPAFRSSKAHDMFQAGDVWIGMPEILQTHRDPRPFHFLVLEHLRHHLRLGFRGTMMVVLPETAALLLASADILQVVKQQQLVLVLWEYGHVEHSRNILPIPANNLLKAAMVGSNTTLGIWDLDEFLVLPRHHNISYEVSQGCLTHVHDPSNLEAVIAFTLTLPPESSSGPDVDQWQRYGGFEAAMKRMHYTVQPYKHCMFGIFCKALINPDSDYNMHVHQLVRPPGEDTHRNFTERGCAYMHHFYHLWNGPRAWWDPSILDDKAALSLADMPFSS